MNRIELSHFLLAILTAGAAFGCGGGEEKVDTPIRRETPADEVLRIGTVWISNSPEQKILSPPSPISMFRTQRSSTLTLSARSASEVLVVDEEVELRAGGRTTCSTTFSHDVEVRWGRKNGEAAVELVRPALTGSRNCDGQHPEPVLAEPTHRALFVLRSDQLHAVEPATDKRQYLPSGS